MDVQTSLAAAMSIGLKPGRFFRDAKLFCLNILLNYDEGCLGKCSYCGLSRERELVNLEQTFIRVNWPSYSLETILEQVKTYPHSLERACVSMITHPRAVKDSVKVIRLFKSETDLYISALVAPTVMDGTGEALEMIKAAGADMCGVAIDAATPELFDQHRGKGVNGPHRWKHFWKTVEEAVKIFGQFKVGVHLIVGLGETEREMVQIIQKAYDLGAATHLFSFFPERGSLLADHPQPPVSQYRRIQLARYLINECQHSADRFSFAEDGSIVSFGYPELGAVIARGLAFMTSGCPGKTRRYACNRPFGNERPSETLRNYPFPPSQLDLQKIREELNYEEYA